MHFSRSTRVFALLIGGLTSLAAQSGATTYKVDPAHSGVAFSIQHEQNKVFGIIPAMIGNVVEANFLALGNYPVAASLSIILMAAILLVVGLYVKFAGTKDLV